MTCANCALNIERTLLKKVPGVVSAVVNLAAETATVTFLPTVVSPAGIARAVEGIGYGAVLPDTGALSAVELQRMRLGEPDASGRRSPEPVPNDTYTLQTDLAIIAVGTQANPVLLEATKELTLNKRGYVEVNEHGETSIPNVFAGGDIVSGAATVILAMGAGRTAAKEIAKRLGKGDIYKERAAAAGQREALPSLWTPSREPPAAKQPLAST